MAKWIQKAAAKMKKKGTEGKFGKATEKKIAAAKKEGGVEKKRAVFAENMKKIAREHETKGEKKHDRKMNTSRVRESRGMKKVMGDVGKHKGVGEHEGYHVGMKKKG